VHLPRIGKGEGADLEVDDHQAAQAPVEEDQVHAIPGVTDPQPLLAADEAKIAAQLQQEGLQMANQGLFQIALGVLVLEVEKLQDEGILDRFPGADGVLGQGFLPLFQHGRLVL